jgi:carboxyl-terminal processing protease
MRPGINYVTVVAREDNEIASHNTFIVRRDGPDGALLETPKNDDEFFHPDSMDE